MTILSVRDLQKSYGDKRILNIREISLNAGEVALLQGDNGSGKTTLMRILAGLITPNHCGHFSFLGKKIATPPAVVYLHQSPYLFSGSVQDNVEYGLRRCRLPLAWAKEAMQWASVESIASAPVKTLSGGVWRRVALARVRALRPQVYLLDEPLAHLDADGAETIRALLRTLHEENATAIIATHDTLPATTFWRLSAEDQQLTVTDKPHLS